MIASVCIRKLLPPFMLGKGLPIFKNQLFSLSASNKAKESKISFADLSNKNISLSFLWIAK